MTCIVHKYKWVSVNITISKRLPESQETRHIWFNRNETNGL